MFPEQILNAARLLTERCVERNVRVVFAESCTGGLVAAAVTALPGASRVVDRGFIVYSYDSKEKELEVPRALSEKYGAVSEQVAIAMAEGALKRADAHAELSIAVTGVAGPDGSPTKPPGLVHVAVAWLGHGNVVHEKYEFGSLGRDRVRAAAVLAALNLAAECLDR
jgi:nicotinamide-nucleotide amidase